jgi:flagellar basal-body rod modification protein FlgD
METGLINAISTNNSNAANGIKASSKELDKNAFLSLLVAQLKNQDPTQSQDTNQMVQQMTSFSTLEQMQNMSTALQGIQTQNGALFEAQCSSLIGKQVQVTSSSFNLKSGQATVGINLSSDAYVSLQIKDASDKVVATLDQGAQTAGSHVVSWDGTGTGGGTLPDGTYTVNIIAKDNGGKDVAATTSAFVRVESVSFINGTVMITAGGKTFSISDITQISA